MFQGLLAGLWLAGALAGCTLADSASAGPGVVVTIKPVHALVAGVMEGVGAPPELLMEGMISPHSYQLRPSQAGLLVNADLVIWVGPGVESSFPEIIRMLPENVRVLQLTEAQGLVILRLRERGVRDHSRDHDQGRGHDQGQRPEDQGQRPERPESSGGLGIDPHFWLDPENAIATTTIIADELSALDPANADRYQANAREQIMRLRALDAELGAVLAPVREVPFMTFHDAYQYFERAYGLRSVAAIALSPERMPGVRTVMALRYAIMDQGVGCVFAEPQFEPRLVATLIEGTGARAGVLDPLGRDVAAGPGAYEAIMRNLARDAVACLQGH